VCASLLMWIIADHEKLKQIGVNRVLCQRNVFIMKGKQEICATKKQYFITYGLWFFWSNQSLSLQICKLFGSFLYIYIKLNQNFLFVYIRVHIFTLINFSFFTQMFKHNVIISLGYVREETITGNRMSWGSLTSSRLHVGLKAWWSENWEVRA
jgi:hypothetical protein